MSNETVISSHDAGKSTTLRLLVYAGIIAPLLFGITFIIDGTLKTDYSALNEAISYLELGVNGWIQQANFITFGLLLIAFTVGYAETMRSVLPKKWLYPVVTFLTLSDLGWIMAGFFIPDTFLAPQTSWHAMMHQIASIIIFLPFAIASLIQAAKLIRTRGWQLYGAYCLLFGVLQAVFPLGNIIYLINPTVVGNVNSPNDGVVNRIVLLLGPFAWYLITGVICARHNNLEN